MAKPKRQNPKPKTEARIDPWFKLVDAQRAFNVSRTAFDATYRPHVPAGAVRNAGRKGVQIHLRQLIDSYLAFQVEAARPKVGDPMLAGGDSPGLERYRMAKAEIAEIGLAQLRGTHVSRAKMEPLLVQLAGAVRRAIEDIQRQWGNGPADAIREAIDEVEAAWLRVLDPPSTADGATPEPLPENPTDEPT